MKIIQDNLWLCVDCTIVACNGDYSGIEDQAQIKKINAGLEDLGPHLVPDFNSETGDGMIEFGAHQECACCKSGLAGAFHRFAILGE